MIEVNNITKIYRIPHEKRSTLFETLLGYIKKQMEYETLYALKDITFTIKEGDVVGLIGKNGSGKTTLLKILAGIVPPTQGTFRTNGKVAPFLGLGIGFHNELTAQENMYLYGAILGLSRAEIKKEIHTILRYAGVERFKDTKLKNFSSGMMARLAFATMIHTNPDILLLDEIFAVGDKDFKPKCIEVFKRYRNEGKTVIFASHDLETVALHCNRTILLHEGHIKAIGKTNEVLQIYDTL